MKIFDIRRLDDSELHKELSGKQRELFDLRIKKVTSTLSDFNKMDGVRRDIARIKTVIHERKIIRELQNDT